MTRRSNTSALLRLASHLAALAASGYLVYQFPGFLASLVIAIKCGKQPKISYSVSV